MNLGRSTPSLPAGETATGRRAAARRSVLLWLAASVGLALALGALSTLAARTLDLTSPLAPPLPEPTRQGGGAVAADSWPPADFRLPTLDGESLGPPDFVGKPMVLDLWASWCVPCRAQAAELARLQSELGDEVQILGVNIGESEDIVRGDLERHPVAWPTVLDRDQTLMRRYRASGLPTVLVVDVTGRVRFVRTGVTDAAILRDEIRQSRPQPISR
ncbi:MAG: TlpA disulfide reductase family protein [Acidobacteriota bacterium]